MVNINFTYIVFISRYYFTLELDGDDMSDVYCPGIYIFFFFKENEIS